MENNITEYEASLLEKLRLQFQDLKKERGDLIPILQKIQEKLHYLPVQAIKMTADLLGITESEVYGVATFYNQFRFNPPGRHPIKVCLGTACHVKGGEIILENFERKLQIKEGQTTEDREFSLERAACVGCCALAPVAVVGDTTHGKMAPSKVEGIFVKIKVDDEKKEREKN